MRIRELEENVSRKNDEIANLKSHLDKFQSVFNRNRGVQIRQRAQGISAEPMSSMDSNLINANFPTYAKEER